MTKWTNQRGKAKRKVAKQAGQMAPKCQLIVHDTDSPDDTDADENHHQEDAENRCRDDEIQGTVSTSAYNNMSSKAFNNESESEGESFMDSDAESMDHIIDDMALGGNNSPDHHVLGTDSQRDLTVPSLISPSMIATAADDIFCKEYVVDPPLMHLPPVSETLADIITHWCRVPPKKDDIKTMFKHSLVPINALGLFPVKINEPVYRKLSLKAKIADQKLRGLNTFIARGMGPILSIFHELCQIEAASKNVSDKTVVCFNSARQLVIDEVKKDFEHMRTKMGHAMRLLATAHSILLQCRKAGLRSYLDSKFHYLTRESNLPTTWLLGDNLENKVTETVRVSDVAKRLTFNRTTPHCHPYFRRGTYNRLPRSSNYPRQGSGHYPHRREFSRSRGRSSFQPRFQRRANRSSYSCGRGSRSR